MTLKSCLIFEQAEENIVGLFANSYAVAANIILEGMAWICVSLDLQWTRVTFTCKYDWSLCNLLIQMNSFMNYLRVNEAGKIMYTLWVVPNRIFYFILIGEKSLSKVQKQKYLKPSKG